VQSAIALLIVDTVIATLGAAAVVNQEITLAAEPASVS
jgi:hypothetical protein